MVVPGCKAAFGVLGRVAVVVVVAAAAGCGRSSLGWSGRRGRGLRLGGWEGDRRGVERRPE